MRLLTLASDPELLSTPIQSDVAFSLFSDDVIEFQGNKYRPDETKGYFKFNISTGFPAGITAYGTALWSGTIERSFASLLHQPLNYEHQVKAYYKEPGQTTNVEDRYLGSILAVDFPRAPGGGWKLNSTDAAPHITGVACFAKLATALNKVVGDHQTGRHTYTVSMEVQYYASKSGFAVATNGKSQLFQSTTPDHFAAAGYEYVPWSDAPSELRATFSDKKNRIVSKYKNRDVYMLMGGIDGQVHYAGVGLVKYGAEKTAAITRLAASQAPLIAEPFEGLTEAFEAAIASASKR